MVSQPAGTVTLLFTDVEGSTRLLERLGTEPYAAVLEQHRRLLREAFTENEGYEFGSALRARTCSRVSAGWNEAVPAGVDVVAQGAPGDRLYTITEGEVEVIADGASVSRGTA